MFQIEFAFFVLEPNQQAGFSTLGGCHIFFLSSSFLPNLKIEVIRVFNVREQYNHGPRRTHPLRNDRNDTKFSLVLNEQALICYQPK